MAARSAAFPLADCHESVLQRVIDLCDREDLFLLRLVSSLARSRVEQACAERGADSRSLQVARRFRVAVDRRVRRLRPWELPADLAARFPGLVSLDLQHCSTESCTAQLGATLAQLPRLRELLF